MYILVVDLFIFFLGFEDLLRMVVFEEEEEEVEGVLGILDFEVIGILLVDIEIN